jgi:dolichol-phosphate mannosyltransferase
VTRPRLGVVSPMANEEPSAARFVDAVLDECERFGFESVTLFAVVDTASRDATREVLERHRLERPELDLVWAPENRNVVDAYLRGYREALRAGCDWILEIDAGFSHSPADIAPFFCAMRRGSDCVFGTRFAFGGRDDAPLRRRVVSRGGTVLANLLLGTSLSDMTSGFQLFTRTALEHVLAQGIASTGPFFQTEMKAHCRDLRVAEVPIRYAGASHRVGGRALGDALRNLWRLSRGRLGGAL